MGIDRDGPDYVWEQVADDIRRRCRSGEWPPNHRIPSSNELAAEYDVALMTIRKVIGKLVAEGVLKTRPGRGTFVC